MIAEAIDRILRLSEPNLVHMDDRTYSDKTLTLIGPPRCAPFSFERLAGFIDYIANQRDDLNTETVVIVVEGPRSVRLLGALSSVDRSRECYTAAECAVSPFKFGDRIGVEDFVIRIQTQFEETPDRERLVKMVSSMSVEEAVTIADDGYSQKIATRAGVTLLHTTKVANPFSLAPFRTFVEVAQPTSPFLFRIHQNNGQMTCGLYECDNGKWKIDAVKSIQSWIADKLGKAKIKIPVLA
jgi:hypothetical protein